jgi:hypothetical protein
MLAVAAAVGCSPLHMSGRASGLRSFAPRISVVAAAVAAAVAIAPRLPFGPWADLVTFVGGVLVGIGGVAIATRAALAPREVIAVDLLAAGILVAAVLLRSPTLVIGVDAALVAIASATGGAIGERVQRPGHLLPAAAIAAAADIASVVSSWGPSHTIAESERALSVAAIGFPVIGTHAVAPVLGVGDLVFVALLLGAARRHELPYLRIVGLALLGIALAGFASARTGVPIPALPAIGATVIAGVPAARRIARSDRTVTTIAIGIALFLTVWVLLPRSR